MGARGTADSYPGVHRRRAGLRRALLISALATLAVPAAAQAGTIVVNTTADQAGTDVAHCSLREAVDATNGSLAFEGCSGGPGDTILLGVHDYPLTRAGLEDLNSTGDLDVTKTVTVKGLGANLTGIDGRGLDGVFHVGSGVTLTLSGVTVHGGQTGGGGGGISGNAVTLNGSAVTGNQSAGLYGGGLFVDTAILVDSDVSGNVSYLGGGGIEASSATLTRSAVNDNRTQGTGGGIDVTSATLTDSTVSGNKSGLGGGGLHGSSAELTRSVVSGNAATGGEGGGIEVPAASLTDSTVRANSASGSGGGLSLSNGSSSMTRSTVSSNSAGAKGGGIYAAGSGTLAMTSGTISDNDSVGQGGGVLWSSSGTLEPKNSTLSGNRSTQWGGGLSVEHGTVNLANATISDNLDDSDNANEDGGGGGIDQSSGTVSLENSVVARNRDGSPAPTNRPDLNCVSLISSGYNLIGDTTGCSITATTGDQFGTAGSPIDPLLLFLASNGGSTKTSALDLGSPALNEGNPAMPGSGPDACEATDQRGEPRHDCDIGAYERDETAPRTTSLRVRVRHRSATGTFKGTDAGPSGKKLTFQCKLDTKSYKSCKSGVRYSVSKGRHKLYVRAIDATGNVASPATKSFKA